MDFADASFSNEMLFPFGNLTNGHFALIATPLSGRGWNATGTPRPNEIVSYLWALATPTSAAASFPATIIHLDLRRSCSTAARAA